jgi:hypothetical protein
MLAPPHLVELSADRRDSSLRRLEVIPSPGTEALDGMERSNDPPERKRDDGQGDQKKNQPSSRQSNDRYRGRHANAHRKFHTRTWAGERTDRVGISADPFPYGCTEPRYIGGFEKK